MTETVQRLRDETRDLREELDVLHKTNTEKAINTTNTSSKGTPIVNSNRMKSILSEAAASGTIPTHEPTNRPGKASENQRQRRVLMGRPMRNTANWFDSVCQFE